MRGEAYRCQAAAKIDARGTGCRGRPLSGDPARSALRDERGRADQLVVDEVDQHHAHPVDSHFRRAGQDLDGRAVVERAEAQGRILGVQVVAEDALALAATHDTDDGVHPPRVEVVVDRAQLGPGRGLGPELQPDQPLVAHARAGPGQLHLDQAQQAVPGVVDRPQLDALPRERLLDAVLQRLDEDVLLTRKVVVHRAGARPAYGGDVLHPYRVVATLGDQPPRRLEDGPLPVVFAGARTTHHEPLTIHHKRAD